MSALAWLGVALLGGIASVARFELDRVVQLRIGGEFPFGTLVVNTVGSFALGVLTGLGATDDTAVLAGTATLGSFTTFSTWMLETERLGEDGESAYSAANIAVSIACGLCAAGAGWALGAAL